MKNKEIPKEELKKILLDSAKGSECEDAIIEAINELFSDKPIVLKDVCEACGQPTKNFEIHPHCRKWWCFEDKEMCAAIDNVVNDMYEYRQLSENNKK